MENVNELSTGLSFNKMKGNFRSMTHRCRRLKRKLLRLASSVQKNMRVGVHILHLETGEEVGVEGKNVFPLASISKIPIFIEALIQLQEAERLGSDFSLETKLVIKEPDKCIGSGTMHCLPAGSIVSFSTCLEHMMTISDNTAADLVLKTVSIEKVRKRMEMLGMATIDIHLSQRQAFMISLVQAPEFINISSENLVSRWKALSSHEKMKLANCTDIANEHVGVTELQMIEDSSVRLQMQAGLQGYQRNRKVAMTIDNVGSPADFTRLLSLLVDKNKLNTQWREFGTGLMACQRLGQRRIPGFLPKTARTYQKTGTILGVVNALGFVTVKSLSEGFVIAVFIDSVDRYHEREAEAVIARASKMAFNVFCSPNH